MSDALMNRLLRPEWLPLLDEPSLLVGAAGPAWEDDFDALHQPLTGFSSALRARMALLLGGVAQDYWLEARVMDMQCRLMQLFKPESRLLLTHPESRLHLLRLQALGLSVDVLPAKLASGPVEPDQVLECWQGRTALVWLQSPAALSGHGWSADAVDELCRHLNEFSLVVLDLSLDAPATTGRWQNLFERHSNLLLLREFSALWGLSGLQLAALQAPVCWVELLQRLWPEVQVSRTVERAALDLLTRENQFQAQSAWENLLQDGRRWCARWQQCPQVLQAEMYETTDIWLQVRNPAALVSAMRKLRQTFAPVPENWLNQANCFRIPLQDQPLIQAIDHWLQAGVQNG